MGGGQLSVARRRADTIYLAPWREQLPDGSLSETYGPTTPSAYAKALRRFENWAWRWAQPDPASDAREVIGYMRDGETGELREDVPDSEREVYLAVYERGQGVRQAARSAGLSRETVRSYLRRLKARVSAGKGER
jgi:DNA-directed RNA polymerase specialized sigma24 family protein